MAKNRERGWCGQYTCALILVAVVAALTVLDIVTQGTAWDIAGPGAVILTCAWGSWYSGWSNHQMWRESREYIAQMRRESQS